MVTLVEPILKTVRDPNRGQRNLTALASHLGAAGFNALSPSLGRLLPRTADPDMALNNLERLLAQPSARQQLPLLLESRQHGLEAVLQLLATSQFFADTLATFPEFLESIRNPSRRNPSTSELTEQLRAEVDATGDDVGVLRAFRRFRNRHTLRIGINDVIRDRTLEEVTRELARLADASIEVALQHAQRTVFNRFGTPMAPDARPARITALAFGKLGGDELNYSSDIDLMFVYDNDGETTGRRSGIQNSELFDRVVKEVVRLLSAHTDRGLAYRVDLRLRPEGNRGPLARSMASTLSYYDTMGRTWERQALIKLRHVGGDPTLGREFLTAIEPFVYRKYLSFAEINEVKALKRKMEQNAGRTAATEISGDIPHDLKTGRGGIRDIEYAVQFLQLLNGGDLPAVRQRNTLLALEALEITGCLTSTETFRLADAYRFLRKTEHRLQLLFDLQTHKLPTSPEELRKLALRMGYQEKSLEEAWKNKEPGAKEERDEASTASTEGTLFSSSTASNIDDSALPRSALVPQRETIAAGPLSATGLAPQKRSPIDESAPPPLDTRDLLIDPLDQFLKDLHDKTNHDRTILNHLLHQTFQDAGLFPRSSGASSASGANLSGETSAPRAATPGGSVAGVAGEISGEPEADLILDPEPDDITVRSVMSRYPFRDIPKAFTNLSQLARESVPFLSSRRCRHFLASIAPQLLRTVSETPDPDEALTQLERVSASLGAKAVLWELFSQNPPILKLYVELCAGSPFLSGLLINNPGMIDELLDSLVLNQPRTPEELRSELAELCRGARDLDPILHSFQDKEFLRIGVSDLLGKAAIRQTTAALSDVADTVLNQVAELMEPAVESRWGQPIASGSVANGAMKRYALLGLGKLGGREISYHSDLDLLLVYDVEGRTTTGEPNSQYFTELAQRVIKTLSQMGSMGRLYSVDMRLRPTGKSGALVLPLAELQRYFEGPACQLWERQSLSRARVIRSEPAFAAEVTTRIQEAMLGQSWCSRLADELVAMRQKLVSTASPRSLKRGPGGIVDIEFVVQLLLIKYGREHPEILRSNVWESLDALKSAALLSTSDADALLNGYSFLRLVEARLRIVTDRPLTEVPDRREDQAKLARRLGFDGPEKFIQELKRIQTDIRTRFEAIAARERN